MSFGAMGLFAAAGAIGFAGSNGQLYMNIQDCYANKDVKGLGVHLVRAGMVGVACALIANLAITKIGIFGAGKIAFNAKWLIAVHLSGHCISWYKKAYLSVEQKICELRNKEIPLHDKHFIPRPFSAVPTTPGDRSDLENRAFTVLSHTLGTATVMTMRIVLEISHLAEVVKGFFPRF